MTTLVSQLRRTFRGPEIWLVLQALGAVPATQPVPPEITADPNSLPAARARLVQQGFLLTGALGQVRLAPEIEALVRPAVYPETVIVASISDNPEFGNMERLACFGWTPLAAVANWVDDAKDHHFEAFAPPDAVASVWDHLEGWCFLDIEEANPGAAQLSPAQMQSEIAQTRQTVLLMATQALQSARPISTSISWFVSGRRAWLIQQTNTDGAQAPQPVSPADLRQAVCSFVARALPTS